MEIRKWLPFIFLGVLLVLGFAAFSAGKNSYNTAVNKEENIKKNWSQVENQYQRRADLIPNLVNTVKGYANFEQQTLQAVIEARAKATQVQIKADDLSPEKIQQFEQAQSELGGAIGRLLVSVERYPDLKANENFLALQTQLEGTENRISVERKNFNEAVNDYNAFIRRFPTNIFVGMFGFSPKGYFQATPGSDKAPQVQF